jgi:hypothetical protein
MPAAECDGHGAGCGCGVTFTFTKYSTNPDTSEPAVGWNDTEDECVITDQRISRALLGGVIGALGLNNKS